MSRFEHLADSGKDCQAADEAVSAVMQVAHVLKRYYTSEEYLNTVSIPPWGLASNVPTIYLSNKVKNSTSYVQATPRPPNERQDLPAATFYYVLESWVGPALGNSAMDNISLAAASFFNLDHTNVPGNYVP